MKKCPFCAEEIQEEAVKCKHCGEFIIDAELKKLKSSSGGGVDWYYKTPMVILWIMLLGPFALPFIFKNPKYSASQKTVWSFVAIVYTALLTLMLLGIIIFYLKFLEQISSRGL